MDWRTISSRILHLIRQLDCPQQFLERVVVVYQHDSLDPISPPHDSSNVEILLQKLHVLKEKGFIDRIVMSHPSSQAPLTLQRWFGLENDNAPMNCDGTIVSSTLHGTEICDSRTDVVLKVDSGVSVHRNRHSHQEVVVESGLPLRVPSPFGALAKESLSLFFISSC